MSDELLSLARAISRLILGTGFWLHEVFWIFFLNVKLNLAYPIGVLN